MVSTASMDLSALTLDILAWLLTYAVHSTVLILAVWLLTATVIRSHTTRDTLWKLALVGGVFTATLQIGLGVRPVFGNISQSSRKIGAIFSALTSRTVR